MTSCANIELVYNVTVLYAFHKIRLVIHLLNNPRAQGEGHYFRSAIYTRVNAWIAERKVMLNYVMDDRRWMVFVVIRIQAESGLVSIKLLIG